MYPDQYPDKLMREDGSEVACRFYPGSRGDTIKKVVDGAQVDVQYTIVMPEDTPVMLIGEIVSGYDERGDSIVWNAEIVLFHHGQLHCKAYV